MSSPQPVTLPATGTEAGGVLFDRFLAEVARGQLAQWLPPEPSVILDLSRSCARLVGLMLERGHTVVHGDPAAARPHIEAARAGRLLTVQADACGVEWVADGTVDAVVAEGGT